MADNIILGKLSVILGLNNTVEEDGEKAKQLAQKVVDEINKKTNANLTVNSNMADVIREVEKGKQKIENTVSSTKFKIADPAGLEEVKKYLNETPVEKEIKFDVQVTNEDVLRDVTQTLEQMGVKGEEADKIISRIFDDPTQIQKYTNELIRLEKALEKQRAVISQLEKQAIPAPYKSEAQINRTIKTLDKEKSKLEGLEKQLDSTYSAQDKFVKSQVQLSEKLDDKTEAGNMAVGVNMVTSSLRSLDQIAPGLISNISNITTQVTAAKRAFQSAADPAMAWAGVLTAGAGIAVTLAVAGIKQLQQAEEERQQKFKEGVEKSKQYANEIETLQKNLDILNDQKASTDAVTNARKNLADTFEDLVVGYTDEGNAILANNKALEKYLENKDKEAKITREKNLEDGKKDYDEYSKRLTGLNDAKKYINDPNTLKWGSRYETELSVIRFNEGKRIEELANSAKPYFEEIIKDSIELEAANKGLSLSYEDLSKKQKALADVKIFEALQTPENLVNGGWESVASSITDIITDAERLNKELSKSTVVADNAFSTFNNGVDDLNKLSSAYEKLTNGESLDAKNLSELLSLYPELAKYIYETGDLSLDNGEKVKEAWKAQKQALIEEQEERKKVLTEARNEKAAKGEPYKEEQKHLNDVIACLKLYEQELKDIDGKSISVDLSQIKSETDELGKAFATLSEGKKLDMNTTLNLIESNLGFAKAIADGTVELSDQKAIVQELFNAKKAEALASIEQEKTKLQGLKNQTDAMNKLIAKEQLWTNLTIESFIGESKKNSALQDQIKILEHKKALNQLSFEEELSQLQTLYSLYATTADERMDLERRIYSARQSLQRESEQYDSEIISNELKNLEHKKALEQLNHEQELAWLQTLYSSYVLTADECMDLERRMFSLRQTMRTEALKEELALMEHQKSLEQLNAKDELAWLERINNQYEMNVEEKRNMEVRLYNAKKALYAEEEKILEDMFNKRIKQIDELKTRNKMSAQEELTALRKLRDEYKLTAEQQLDVYKRIKSLKQQIKSDDSSRLDNIGNAVVEALRNKYEEQKKLEEDRINESIESWKTWEEKTVGAIQGQIDAIDELANAQQSENERQEYEQKRQATALQLAYEKDDYNRKQLQKELNRLDKAETERLEAEAREQQKKALQQQIEEVQKQSESQQESLQKELDVNAENYEKFTSKFALENEAYKTMVSHNQKEILDIIKSYAPEYDLAGKTLGERLINSISLKGLDTKNFEWQFKSALQVYQAQMASTAQQAANDFWSSRAEYEKHITSQSVTNSPTVNMTVNFNEPVESPAEVQRKMAQITQEIASQLR